MTTVETILTEIAKLSPGEQEQLRQQLNESYARNGQTTNAQNGQPVKLKKETHSPFPEPIPVPNEGKQCVG